MSITTLAAGDRFEIQDGQAMRRVGTQLSLLVWYLSPSATTNGQMLQGQRLRLYIVPPGGWPTGEQLYIEGGDFWSGSPGNWYTPGGSLPRPTRKWRCISLSYDAGSTSNVPAVYIDARAQVVSTDSAPTGTATGATEASVTMLGNNAAANDPAEGALAHYAAWNRILSAAEHARAYRFGPLAVPQGLVFYTPLDRTQPGGVTLALVGGPAQLAAMRTAAADYGDPYHGRYVGSHTYRRARTSPTIRTLTPSSVTTSSGWTAAGGASTLDEGVSANDAKYDTASDTATMLLPVSNPTVSVDTTQPVRLQVHVKHL